MESTKTRINLWSGPRNISTAMMYSFAQRKDTVVYDEPLYGYYLRSTNADVYHPGAQKVLSEMETDGDKVISMMEDDHGKPIAFFKQMTHHLHDLDKGFMKKMTNVILTRDPNDMLPSFAKEIENPTMIDVGYKAHLDLIKYFNSEGIKYVVLDSKKVLDNPKVVLEKLCERLSIPFDQTMLSWKPGAIPEDGSWAEFWYESVHKSSGFMEYKPKTAPFPDRLKPLLKECLPVYNELKTLAL